MAQVIVRNIEAEVKAGLKQRATQHGWHMEEEVRQILRNAVNQNALPAAKTWQPYCHAFCGYGSAFNSQRRQTWLPGAKHRFDV